MTTNTNEFGISSLKMFVSPAGSRKKSPIARMQRERDRAGPRRAADLLLLALLVLGQLRVRRDAERLEADLERLAERDDAADDRQPVHAVALRPRDERLGDDLDLAVGDLDPLAAP